MKRKEIASAGAHFPEPVILLTSQNGDKTTSRNCRSHDRQPKRKREKEKNTINKHPAGLETARAVVTARSWRQPGNSFRNPAFGTVFLREDRRVPRHFHWVLW